jgi:hypothetical protein
MLGYGMGAGVGLLAGGEIGGWVFGLMDGDLAED